MVEDSYLNEIAEKTPKKTTFYASFLTGVLALAALITDTAIRNVIIISAPLATYGITVCGKSLLHLIECRRGEKIYKELISDLETELNSNPKTGRSKEIEKQLEILRADLQNTKRDAIRIMIH